MGHLHDGVILLLRTEFFWFSFHILNLVNQWGLNNKNPNFQKKAKPWRILFKCPIYNSNCGQQEERAILISRLLLRMRRMYVGSIRLEFHYEYMECTEHTLMTRVWTFYHS